MSRASAAPASVRMNKADLEAHVVKLERGLARAKAQNAELKKALKDAQQSTTMEAAPPAAKPARATRKTASSAPVKRARRTKAEMAQAAEAQETEAASSDDE